MKVKIKFACGCEEEVEHLSFPPNPVVIESSDMLSLQLGSDCADCVLRRSKDEIH
jgi:hypothetical protein